MVGSLSLRLWGAFRLDEDGSDSYRANFLSAHPEKAAALREAEQKRRERKAHKAGEPESESDQLELEDGEEE